MNRYLGRKSVVRNLLDHLAMGGSAVVAGGPKMGKTTFLQQTAGSLIHTLKPVLIDLARGAPPDPAGILPDRKDPLVLLMDGCESLLPNPTPFLNRVIQVSKRFGKHVRGHVWSGSVAWGEWAMAHRSEFGNPIRYYPLIALPPKEARPFLRNRLRADVPPPELERLLELSGGHPYLLSRMVEQPDGDSDPFFMALWNGLESPAERDVMARLIGAGSWVFLHDLKNASGGKTPKALLTRLAILGLINRTLVDGAAAARPVSPLLGEWVRRTGRTPSLFPSS